MVLVATGLYRTPRVVDLLNRLARGPVLSPEFVYSCSLPTPT